MTKDLVVRIKARASDPKLRTDACDGHSTSYPVFLAKPASTAVIAEAERKLGFELPPLLRTLYRKVANGGFGPAYGIIGLDENGWLDVDHDVALPDLYAMFRRGDNWPDRFLPICNDGCGMYSIIDCNTVNAEMVFSGGVTLEGGGIAFEQWLEKWVNRT